jgi:hypothetical protein
MRRIKQNGENESIENAREAFERFADQKHKRWNVMRYEQDIDLHVHEVVCDIVNDTFSPSGYTEKWIFEKKPRKLAKAPVYDHHTEAAAMLPYEKAVYDHISWRSPAVRPGLGTHALLRFVRNDLFANEQLEVCYDFVLDIHHYFPLMDHFFLKRKIDNKFKKGKFRNFIHRVIDSFPHGAPLGIKMAQLFGMLYLADFDRLVERCFDILDNPEKMDYWTSHYIAEWCVTARSPDEMAMLARGSQFMARRFRLFVEEGILHYYRFVDNILVIHEDKVFLRCIRDLTIMVLTRDYRAEINGDFQVRPVWMGIRLCGYNFLHERVAVSKRNKQEVARRAHKLQKLGFSEEQIRIKLASNLGYIKHADSINLLKKIGMENSLGKIIKHRRVKPPFEGMSPEQKVPFSTLVVKIDDKNGGGVEATSKKIYLLDYTVTDSKIDREIVTVMERDARGIEQEIKKEVPSKVLAIRFKKILKTFTNTGRNGEEETYVFQKKLDKEGRATDSDAEFYAFTGSRIMIDQATRDFGPADLPAPTVIMQEKGKDGKYYTKFT